MSDSAPARAILTDIEGTTSSLSFVKDVLFPYARERMDEFIREHGDEPPVRRELGAVSELAGKPLSDREATAQLLEWIDEDRKATPLKALQGMIWEHGYRQGDFKGHVYEDAARRLYEWADAGLRLCVFSSGSVQAQKLLFGHSEAGDLTPLFSGWFDTRIGAKHEAEAYRRIAGEIGLPPNEILFLSDIDRELDAAAAAGLRTTLLNRDGQCAAEGHPVATNFDEVRP
ncbi:acireductone synthase [Elongatibacter sediminis]|uniref:Enolase-phosphatase E1 n=1 Tax=Elongatibacter sediminis TaxID=3119006 RepID=A0AAW9RFG9_9GAMM